MTTVKLMNVLAENQGFYIDDVKSNIRYYYQARTNGASYRQTLKEYVQLYKVVKAYQDLELEGDTTKIEYVGENLASDNIRLANSIIQLHDDSSKEHIQATKTVANERAFISRTYKVTLSMLPNYAKFINALMQNIRFNGCKRVPVVTFEEFQNKTMSNGQKIGRYLSRCGIDNSFIGCLDQLLNCENSTLYATISGTTQDIIGMSYFLNDSTSCQNWCNASDIDYALHSFAGSQCLEQYVMYLHNDLSDLEHDLDKEHMLSRTTVLRAVEQGREVFFHGKVYGNKAPLHKQVIELLDGHFNSYYEYDKTSHKLSYRLQGGNYISISEYDLDEMTISNDIGTSFTVCCPMCDGDGYVRHDIHVYNTYVGRSSMTCQLCYGSGEHELELDYDYDGDNATEYMDNDELEELISSERFFKFYNAHAFEGFDDNGSTVGVYVRPELINDYLRKCELQEGKAGILENERKQLKTKVMEYYNLAGLASSNEVDNLTDIELIKAFTKVYGLFSLRSNEYLMKIAVENQ